MGLKGRVLSLVRVGSPSAQHVRVRWLAATMLLGPVFVVAWLLLPHGALASETGVAAMAASALVLGMVLIAVPARHIPDTALKCCLFAVSAVISVGIVFGGESGTVFGLFYFWAVPYAFAYFTVRDGVIHTAWVGACYAVTLLVQRHAGVADGRHPIATWLLLVGSLLVVGTLVRQLTQWGRESDERFRRGFGDSRVPMLLIALDGVAMEVNDAVCEMLARDRRELEGAEIAAIAVHAQDLGANRDAFARASARNGEPETFDTRLVRSDDEVVLAAMTVSVVRDDHGSAQYYFVQVQDVTAERGTLEELRRRGRQQQAIARLGQLALSERDPIAFAQHLAETAAETLGVERASVLELDPVSDEFLVTAGCGWPDGLVGTLRTPAHDRSPAGFALASRSPIVIDDVLTDTRFEIPDVVRALGIRSGIAAIVDGHERPFGVLVLYASQVRTFDDDDVAFVQSAANILSNAADRRRSDDANRYAALHDPLTGLANRTLALDRLKHALARRRRDRVDVAVLVLDLDRFKIINDSLGHDVGDELLLQLAPRLSEAVRPTDTVARLGGDEFIVVCEAVDGAREAMRLASRLAEAIAQPLTLQSGEHFLTASIGLALSGASHDTPETLVRDADAAMYRAKDGGRGRVELFDEGMRKQVLSRLRVETELRRAIIGGELRVHYQPVVDALTGRPQAVEALVRWEHAERGLLGPAEFVAIAEESGLVARLGRFVLEEATAQVAAWQRSFGPLELCVNVSGRQLANPLFPAEVAAIARASGLLPGTLGLEITESVLIEDVSSPVAVLTALHEHGLRLLLDDFGTGYSSLSYLKKFPIDTLKLDRSFVEGIGLNAADTAIVEAIVRMASALEMSVVAEGVETELQLGTLRGLGCERAQGFLFAPPMPACEAADFLAAGRGAAVA